VPKTATFSPGYVVPVLKPVPMAHVTWCHKLFFLIVLCSLVYVSHFAPIPDPAVNIFF